jgi:hypothetical protein
MAESREIILESCIIDFDEIQGGPGAFSLSCNIYKCMMAFLNLSGRVLKKTIITLHIQRFKQSKLFLNLYFVKIDNATSKTISLVSAILIAGKTVANQEWQKKETVGRTKRYFWQSCAASSAVRWEKII